jgi:hypothetical protein
MVQLGLTCYNCREYDSCEKPQETPIHLSKERTTMRVCLQELIKRLEENHGNCTEALAKKAVADVDAVSDATVNPDAPNVLQSMMKLAGQRSCKNRKQGCSAVGEGKGYY